MANNRRPLPASRVAATPPPEHQSQRLRELVEQQPDATTRELHQRLGIASGESAVAMAVSPH